MPTSATNGTTEFIWSTWLGQQGGGLGASTANQIQPQCFNSGPIWTTWINATYPPGPLPPLRQPTARELEAERAFVAARQSELIAQRDREQQWARAEAAEADRKANELLEELLDDEQRASWRKRKVIELTSQRGNRYRLRNGVSGNIDRIERDRVVERMCCHPTGVPIPDVIATQYLALKYAEDHFVRTANRERIAA